MLAPAGDAGGSGTFDYQTVIWVCCNETPPLNYLVRVYPKDAAQHHWTARP